MARNDMRVRGRRSRRERQGGFALPGTLAVLLLSSILVTALLGLTFSTTAFSTDQLGRDSATRAADAALQATIARIARDADGTTGTLADTDLCNWEGADPTDRPTVEVGFEDHDVEVTCEADSPDVYVPDEPIRDRVLVVGEYEGADPSSSNRLTATSWRATLPDGQACLPGADNCFPWREALAAGDADSLQSTPTIDSLLPRLSSPSTRMSIAHTGVDPLRVVGDVQAKHGTAALRNARDCDPNGGPCAYVAQGPGVSASGSYVQGAPGLLAGVDDGAGNPLVDPECGILRRPGLEEIRPFQVEGAQVVALEGVACDSGGAAGLDPVRNQLARPRDGQGTLTWSPQMVASRLAPAPTTSAGPLSWDAQCPPAAPAQARLVRLSPGSYPKDRTEILQRWFACSGAYVFHFLPGDYWFDVERTGASHGQNGPLATERHALVFDDQNNYIVFGAPNGWSSFNNINQARQPYCDPDTNGVSITLTARTSIVHRRGPVSICGKPGSPSQQPQATIWQDPAPDLGVGEDLDYAEGGINTTGFYFKPGWFSFSNIWNWMFNGGSLGDTSFEQDLTWNGQPTNTVPFRLAGPCFALNPFCDGQVTFGARFAPEEGTTIRDGTLESAVLTVTADSNRANGGGARTYVDLYMPDRPNDVACRMQYPRVPEGMNGSGPITLSYDLMNSRHGNCKAVLTAPDIGRKALLDSVAVVTYDLDPEIGGNYWVEVRDVELRTGWKPTPSGSVTCSVPTGGRLRNNCHSPETVTNPESQAASMVRIARQAVSYPCLGVVVFGTCIGIPPGELRYWPSGDTTATYRLPTLDDRFNPNLATDPSSTLTAVGVLLQGGSGCQIIGIDCGSYGVANRSGSSVRVRLVHPSGGTYCQATFKRLPEWGEARYLDLMAGPGGNVEQTNCHTTLANKQNADLLGKTVEVNLNLKPRVPCLPPTNSSNVLDILAAIGTGAGLLCDWWGYDVRQMELITASAGADSAAAYPGPRTPMRVTSDESPGHRASFTMYGPLSIPANDLDVRWSGPRTSEKAVFSGYERNEGVAVTTMVVRGIGSDTRPSSASTTPATGVLCCGDGRPGERIVELRAWIGREDGEAFEPEHLRAVARVRFVDSMPIPEPGDPPPPADAPRPGTYQVANQVRIEDWRVCSRGTDEYDCRIT